MVKIKYFFCLVDWGAMSDVSDDTNELIVIDEGNLLTLDGLPEPQIGPQSGLTLQMPEMVESGDNFVDSLSEDSLEIRTLEGVVPTPAVVSAIGSMAENNRPESARSNRSGNRVIYQPAENLGSTRSSSVQNVMHLNDIETPDLEEDDITNQIEPLIEPNRSSWVGSVLNRVLPELKTSLNAEYDKERAELENEHRSRLQNLHSQHHHQQFELYEKNIKTHEQLQKLEEELEAKNRTISNFGKCLIKEKEKPLLASALFNWRLMLQQRKVEQKLNKIAIEVKNRSLLRMAFTQWHSLIKNKWKTKVEKVCKERATEICIKLKDDLTGEINRLTHEIKNRDERISEMESKQGNYEENLTKALMRGVCALNMEAMSVLHRPEDLDNQPMEAPEPAAAGSNRSTRRGSATAQTATSYEQNINPVAPQNSMVHIPSPSGYNPSHAYISKPASNVFLNTVNSLDDFAAGTQSKRKLTVRNSAEFTGGMAGRGMHLSETNSKGVLIERHQSGKIIRTKSPQKPRQGSEPWRPVGRLTQSLDKKSRNPSKPKQNFNAVKHVD